jgi:hypothetical protein
MADPKNPPENEEQRIAQQREAALREQASTAAAKAEQAHGRATALEGELEKRDAELATLRAENEKLTGQVAGLGAAVNRTGLPTLAVELPKGAYQLRESVTMVAGKKPVRTDAKAGDVVFLEPNDQALDKLRKSIGLVATVHAVGKEQLHELETLGFIVV